MKFLITGVNGQLGYDIKKELLAQNYTNIIAPTRNELDITNKNQVKKIIEQEKPDVIFHCAAYTAVDKAEEEQEICYNVNVNGTKNIVKYAELIGAKIIYISTDYVFDGTKKGIYETKDSNNPINYYGKTKYLGEEAVRTYNNHIIVRISWVFGINGNNFIKTMLKLAETRKELSVVSDQIGSPTYTSDLAKLLIQMALSNKTGTYHATNEGYCSWNEFAKYIFEINNLDIIVNQVLTKDYKTTAKRPLNSKLSKDKLEEDGFNRLPSWQSAVKKYCKELKKEGDK